VAVCQSETRVRMACSSGLKVTCLDVVRRLCPRTVLPNISPTAQIAGLSLFVELL